jgi:hypothetical protein
MNPLYALIAFIALLALSCYAGQKFGSAVGPHNTLIRPWGENDVLDPNFVVDFAAKDVSRLRGSIARVVSRSSPYIDILGGGTLEAGMSEVVRSVVQEQAVIGNGNLVRPAFTAIKDMCGTSGGTAKVGSKEYSYFLGGYRDKGPLVCVKKGYAAYKRAYSSAEDSLKKGFVKINNNDVRITLADRSGCKMVVRHDKTFNEMFAGEVQGIDTELPLGGDYPTAMLNFKTLKVISNTLREDMLVEPFEDDGGTGPILKMIGGQDLLDYLRDEENVLTNQRYLAAGSYKVGEVAIRRYRWEGPYRGVAFGHDSQPLRFNVYDGDGNPVWIEPEVAVETTNGWASRPNPVWLNAHFEAALLMGMDSFKRLVPETYTGEGGFRWPAQLVNGELRFKVIEDNEDNAWGDYGRHFYQLERAYEPIRPHAVTLIVYKRAQASLGLSLIDLPGSADDNSI